MAVASTVMVARYEYDPYGKVTQSAGPYAAANPFRCSTKWFDAETGFGYWGERYYWPELGRWLNRDPIEEAGGVNLYGYVRNRPVNAQDAIGHGLVCCEDKNWPTAMLGPKRAFKWVSCPYDTRLCNPSNRKKCCASRNRSNMAGAHGSISDNVPADDATDCGPVPTPPQPGPPPPLPPTYWDRVEICWSACMVGVGCGSVPASMLATLVGGGSLGARAIGAIPLAKLFEAYGIYCVLQGFGCAAGCQGL